MERKCSFALTFAFSWSGQDSAVLHRSGTSNDRVELWMSRGASS